jgi:hypothetical protein
MSSDDRQRLIQQIDACRAGSEDLSAPEMRELAEALASDESTRELRERLHDFDAAVGGAMHDAAVPEGLAQRISAEISAGLAAEPAAGELDNSLVQPAEKPVRVSRRRWLTSAVSTVAAASIAAVVVWAWWPEPQQMLTLEDVLNASIDFHKANRDLSAASGQPPTEFPMSPDVTPSGRVTWRKISGLLDCQMGVAYNIPGRRGCVATLYVVRRDIPALPTLVPTRSGSDTANVRVAAWQSGDLVYVLILRGSEQDYLDFVQQLDRIIT